MNESRKEAIESALLICNRIFERENSVMWIHINENRKLWLHARTARNTAIEIGREISKLLKKEEGEAYEQMRRSNFLP